MKDYDTTAFDKDRIEDFVNRFETQIKTKKTLYNAWRKVLFAKNETKEEPDLLVAIIAGLTKLIAANADAELKWDKDAKLLLTVRNADQVKTWASLDKKTYALFRLEARMIEGVLGDRIRYRFGRWLDQKPINEAKSRTAKDAQIIEMELGFYQADKDDFDTRFDRVRIFWRPNGHGENTIAFLLPNDLEQLYHSIDEQKGGVRFYNKLLYARDAVSLANTQILSNAASKEPLDSLVIPCGPDRDRLDLFADQVGMLTRRGEITESDRQAIVNAIEQFRICMTETVRMAYKCPEKLFVSSDGRGIVPRLAVKPREIIYTFFE